MKTGFYLLLILLVLAGCRSNKAYTGVVKHYPETAPVEEEVAMDESVTVKQEEVILTHGTEMMRYCIILGSFINEQNAVDLRETLIGMGYSGSCIMQNKQGMYRVAAECFDEEAPARTELLQIRHQYPQYKDAWLLMTK